MRIRHLSIRNFRGIREIDWSLPDRNVLCLIGRGDSTKSTILEALRRVFFPQWNLSFDDADFFQCDPNNSIKIEVVLGNIPDDFRDLGSYGHWLCGWNGSTLRREDDPGDGLEDALQIRLSVMRDLDPSWSVIKHQDDEGIPFKSKDRAKAALSMIGTFSDRHLTWSRGSILSQLTTDENIASLLADAGRAAKNALDEQRTQNLSDFDQVAKKAEETAKSLGVVVRSQYCSLRSLLWFNGWCPVNLRNGRSRAFVRCVWRVSAFHHPRLDCSPAGFTQQFRRRRKQQPIPCFLALRGEGPQIGAGFDALTAPWP